MIQSPAITQTHITTRKGAPQQQCPQHSFSNAWQWCIATVGQHWEWLRLQNREEMEVAAQRKDLFKQNNFIFFLNFLNSIEFVRYV